MKIIPRCKSGAKSSITSQGRWIPCCGFPEYGPEAEQSIFAKDDFLLKNNGDPNLHNSEIFKQWIQGIETEPEKHATNLCWRRCSEEAHRNEKEGNLSWAQEQLIPIRSEEDLKKFMEDNDLDGK